MVVVDVTWEVRAPKALRYAIEKAVVAASDQFTIAKEEETDGLLLA